MKKPATDEAFIKMSEQLENIQRDCVAVGLEKELDHSEVLKKVIARLPDLVKDKWFDYCLAHRLLLDGKNTEGIFQKLLEFMKGRKEIADFVVGDPSTSSSNSKSKFCSVTAVTAESSSSFKIDVQSDSSKKKLDPCLACHKEGAVITDEVRHLTGKCETWKGLSMEAKRKLVKCRKHPFAKDGHSYKDCDKPPNYPCKKCKSKEHTALLCDKKPSKSACKSVSTELINSSLETVMCCKSLVKTLIVKGKTEEEDLGIMEDNCSTDSFVLTVKAEQLDLCGEPVTLALEGINETKRLETKLYKVPIQDKNGKVHYVDAYGLDEISKEGELPDPQEYELLCKKFNVDPEDVKKPSVIHVLLSARDNYLMSDEVVDNIDGVKLYSGPLGMAFMGDIGNQARKQKYPVQATRVMKARTIKPALSNSEILNYFKEENIGADCQPRCGGCQCGKCPTGSQQMTIKEEKLYKRFKDNMRLEMDGSPQDPGPYWVTSYPWSIPREDLGDNYPAVLGVMNATAKKLDKDPKWRELYEKQLRDLVDMNFAVEVNQQEYRDWVKAGNKSYFISHQMVIDDGNLSTPVRCVFNSSQVFQGHSLNGSWELGPDMTGSLHAILLRFRENIVAAQGDIRKMYYAIRVEPIEQWMQLFVWRFSGEKNIRMFRMTRLVMGNKPSANISQIALKETAHLGNNAEQFPAAKESLCRDSYVDNVFQGADNKEMMDTKINDTEHVAAQGGFRFKPWTISGQDTEDVKVGPDSNKVEKTLGLYWRVRDDRLFVKVQIEGKQRKIVLTLNNFIENPALKLTVRECLSLHARCYDPLGLCLPVKMVGNILFRKTLQVLAASRLEGESKLPWDREVEGEVRDKWLDYFQMLEGIKDISFPRSVKPATADPAVKPDIVTFSDGNMDAYGAVAYVLWTLVDGSKEARLVTSKAKLGPLLGKGEVVKNELSGATFAVRIKSWIVENSKLEFNKFWPLVDSMIVKHMVKKEDYNLNTFAGLRVKEISQKSDVTSWHHIASKDNFVADILTKGTDPSNIKEGSEWQCGPKWLILDPSAWPVTKVTLSKEEREVVKGFDKVTKVFKAGARELHSGPSSGTVPEEHWIDKIINKISDLTKIVNIVGHFFRLGGRNQNDLEKSKFAPISASEYDDALKIIIEHEQKKLDKKKFTGFDVTERQFTLNSGRVIELKILRSRVKTFPIMFGNQEDFVFPLPTSTFAKRLAVYHHAKYHRDVDTVVTQIRKEFWIVGLRRIVSKIDKNCRQCLVTRQKVASQVMGSLPPFRTEISSAWSQSSLDLFGPIWIKDAVVTKGTREVRVNKKVWGTLFTCLQARSIYIDWAEDYSTEALLHCIRRYQADKGKISLIVSDPGTQLVGANNELKEVRRGWDQDELIRFGAKNGLEWRFTMASSPHQNGVTEILVKMVKGVMASLMSAIGTSILNLNELFTLGKEVASLVNERPIGLKPNFQTDPVFLSPNSLLLGRCSDRVNSGPFQPKADFDVDPHSDRNRYLLVQKITEQFWRVWTNKYFPTLLRRPKWHHEKRNVCVGDVCLLKDSNAIRGEWKLCRVKKSMPDVDKIVRNVVVTVPPPSLALTKGKDYPKKVIMNDLDRHVSNLIVIVPSEENCEDNSLVGSVNLSCGTDAQ